MPAKVPTHVTDSLSKNQTPSSLHLGTALKEIPERREGCICVQSSREPVQGKQYSERLAGQSGHCKLHEPSKCETLPDVEVFKAELLGPGDMGLLIWGWTKFIQGGHARSRQ